MKGRILNFDYAMIHTFYWMYFGVGNAFAAAFLLEADYQNGEIGIILAAANVLAVFLQPLIADFADRTKKISLIGVVQLCTIFCSSWKVLFLSFITSLRHYGLCFPS